MWGGKCRLDMLRRTRSRGPAQQGALNDEINTLNNLLLKHHLHVTDNFDILKEGKPWVKHMNLYNLVDILNGISDEHEKLSGTIRNVINTMNDTVMDIGKRMHHALFEDFKTRLEKGEDVAAIVANLDHHQSYQTLIDNELELALITKFKDELMKTFILLQCFEGPPLGLVWAEVEEEEAQGIVVNNPALSEALGEGKRNFTFYEWSHYGVHGLTPAHYVVANGLYFKPLERPSRQTRDAFFKEIFKDTEIWLGASTTPLDLKEWVGVVFESTKKREEERKRTQDTRDSESVIVLDTSQKVYEWMQAKRDETYKEDVELSKLNYEELRNRLSVHAPNTTEHLLIEGRMRELRDSMDYEQLSALVPRTKREKQHITDLMTTLMNSMDYEQLSALQLRTTMEKNLFVDRMTTLMDSMDYEQLTVLQPQTKMEEQIIAARIGHIVTSAEPHLKNLVKVYEQFLTKHPLLDSTFRPALDRVKTSVDSIRQRASQLSQKN